MFNRFAAETINLLIFNKGQIKIGGELLIAG